MEERNVTISLSQARNWFNSGNKQLQVLIASFETYANDFFNSVLAYKVKKID